MRGPQSSGMLIGQKDLCKAAYFQAAPHHCYGRALKCSKEEAMSLLAAVQQWHKRDHAAEQLEWLSWLKSIQARLQGLPSTSFEYVQPEDLSNKCPQLRIHWDANVLRITGTELAARLDAGTPRIVVDEATGGRPDMMASSIIIMPYMMEKGEERIIANAIYEGLTKPGHYEAPVIPVGTPAPVQGIWTVTIQYPRGIGEQKFTIGQNGNDLTGIRTTGDIYVQSIDASVQQAVNSRTTAVLKGLSRRSQTWACKDAISSVRKQFGEVRRSR